MACKYRDVEYLGNTVGKAWGGQYGMGVRVEEANPVLNRQAATKAEQPRLLTCRGRGAQIDRALGADKAKARWRVGTAILTPNAVGTANETTNLSRADCTRRFARS